MKLIHRTRWGACLAVAALVMAGATTANAQLATGTLNAADGNLAAASGEIDWANVGGIVCPAVPGGAGGLGCSLDLLQGQGDNSFTQGTKEDTAVPVVELDSIPPNKSDLTRFYIKLETVNNKDYAYLAWERIQDPSGTTNMDFEINKSSTPSANGVTPVRSVGDVLITYDLSKGGTVPTLSYRLWDGSKWGDAQSLAGNFEGSVNNPGNNPPNGVVVDPIAPNAPRNLDAFTFGEASVNLTDSGIIPADQCVAFSSAYLKSRSSDSFTAALKDFVAPAPINFSKCGGIKIVKNTVGGNGTFSYGTSANLGVTNNTFDLTTVSNTASRTFGSLFAGTYTFDETAMPTGWTFTSLTCANDDPAKPASSWQITGDKVDVSLAVLGAVTCTYTNTAQASLTVAKVTDPAPNTVDSFGFTGPNSDTGSIKNGESFTRSSLSPGQYVWTETAKTGFDLTNVVCNDANSVGSVANRTATFNLEAGEAVTCTFTNTQRGQINVLKVDDDDPAVPLAGAIFTLYTDAAPVGGSAPGAEDTATSSTCTTIADGTCSFTNVVPGTYWVVETTTPAGHATAAPQAVTVGAGGTVPLTFVNPRQFTILAFVCKNADSSLYGSGVTFAPDAQKTSISDVPAALAAKGVTEADLCALGGASFSPRGTGNHAGSVDIPQ